eukprot:TRINITY_DN472_c0_g2_i1.p1 TRINITY_DN472_c0_g2~~TRINITY_DN472_c0_g2_i1.p1  ORF type:complete len:232 (+),score=69.11 TRINITY_DN472_c0_g2_i1:63-698(+)
MPVSGILYGHAVSQPCRSVQWYLDYCGNTTVERKLVDLRGKEQMKPEFLAKFPNHQVPAFETEDGFCFGESLAVLKYVARGDPEMTPKTIQDEARLDEYFGRHYSQVRKFTREVFYHHLVSKEMDKKTEGLVVIKPLLETYDALLGKQDYVLGSSLTLADFLFAPEVDQLQFVDDNVLLPYKNILSYLERLTTNIKGYKEDISAMKAAIGL